MARKRREGQREKSGTPVLPAVDCTLRKRKRAPDSAPLVTVEDNHIPFLPGSPSADGDSQYVAKRSFYENGAAYFKEATKYFAWLNEDLRRHDEQIVMDFMYKRSFYENGAAYFKEATKYFAWLNEDLRRHDEQIVMDFMYTEINSESYHEYILSRYSLLVFLSSPSFSRCPFLTVHYFPS